MRKVVNTFKIYIYDLKSIFALITIGFMIFIQGCTYNISMAHTEGTATDTIDDTDTITPDVSPTITLPLVPGV